MTATPEEIAAIVRGLTKAQRWVPGYEGRYCVDERGEIYSMARTFERQGASGAYSVRVPGRRLRQCLNRNGYPFVRLYCDNRARTFEVHRLVCRAFHGEPAAGDEAAHIDGDRTNPAKSNLRWATRSENHADKRRHGTHRTGESLLKSKLTKEQAVAICARALCGETGRSLAREFLLSERAIHNIRKGTLWADATAAVRKALVDDGGKGAG